MRKALVALLVIGMVSVAAVSYAHMRGGGHGPGGYDGPGYGGYGMMRGGDGYDEKTMDETYDLRKALHDKKFQFKEALRKGDEENIEALEKELRKLKDELYEKLGVTGKSGKRGKYGKRGKGYDRRGHGPRWGYDSGGCGGPAYGGYGGYGGCGGPCGWR